MIAGREIGVGKSQDIHKIRNSMGQSWSAQEVDKGGYIRHILIFLFM